MNFKNLLLKQIIRLNSSFEIKDLFQSTIEIKTEGVEYITVHKVTEDEAGRPDKISYKYYNTPNYVDGLLKYNEISNPFALDKDVLLKIPTKATLDDSYRRLEFKQVDVSEKLQRFVDKNKTNKINTAREVFNTKTKRSLPPNILTSGEESISRQAENDKIILGANLTNINGNS